jgi:hypothetical protein
MPRTLVPQAHKTNSSGHKINPIVGDLNISLSSTDRTSRQKVKNILELKNTFDKMDLTDI